MIEDDTWYRCNICGREGRVGRCCSDENRTPLNDLAKAEQERIRGDKMVSFSEALVAVKAGKAIQRSGWNGSGLMVKAQFPDANSKMTLPYLYIEYPLDAKTTPGARCPWLASQTDIMAEDWSIKD